MLRVLGVLVVALPALWVGLGVVVAQGVQQLRFLL
jgi:hypothetical protein